MPYSGGVPAPVRQAEAGRHALLVLPAAAAPPFAPSYRSRRRPRNPRRLACAAGLPSAAAAPPHIEVSARARPRPPPFWAAGVGTRTVSSCPGKELPLLSFALLGWMDFDYPTITHVRIQGKSVYFQFRNLKLTQSRALSVGNATFFSWGICETSSSVVCNG
jgi:hypothetical protein